MGGHSIEDNVVSKRYMKIISNIEKVLMLVDSLALYDNLDYACCCFAVLDSGFLYKCGSVQPGLNLPYLRLSNDLRRKSATHLASFNRRQGVCQRRQTQRNRCRAGGQAGVRVRSVEAGTPASACGWGAGTAQCSGIPCVPAGGAEQESTHREWLLFCRWPATSLQVRGARSLCLRGTCRSGAPRPS
jgi:hypothetical protein